MMLIPSALLLTFSYRGEPVPLHIPQPDLILAADCVYFEPAFPLLVRTLAELVPDNKTEVLFCYKKRRKASSCIIDWATIHGHEHNASLA